MSGEYVRGEMNIDTQKATWEGFMTVAKWSGVMLILAVAYATFTLTMGMNWMIALGILAITGFVLGLVMELGSGWNVAIVSLVVIAVVLQLIIMFAQAVL
ncbi:MAG: aa3-type cytochrome c oxidase subunit IV [Ponticaulis sp.]|nr:aa3-type cytochrome c oxidase subunit IV [Ponticaulis sp.]